MKKRNLAVGIGLAALSAISIVATSVVATSCSEQTTIKQIDTHQLYDIDTESKTYKLHGSTDSSQPLIMDDNGLVYADQNKTDLIAYIPSADNTLTEITIPASVRLISNAYIGKNGTDGQFSGTFKGAFENSNITKISFEEGSQLSSIKSFAFDNAAQLSSIEILSSNGNTIGLPSTLTSIGHKAFRKTKLGISLSLASVIEIGEGAFEGITGTSFAVTGLTSLRILGSEAFKNSTLKYLDLSKVTSLTYLPANCFTGTQIQEVTTQATTKGVRLPSNISDISNAFQGATSLTTVTLDSAIKNISASAFDGCTSLATVNLQSSNITNIPSSAFQGCTSLVTLNLPTVLKTISEDAFKSCTKLSSLSLPAALTSIGNQAFQGCTALSNVSFVATSSSFNSIGWGAFQECTSLSNVDLSKATSLNRISDLAFNNCTSLTTVKLPASLTTIGRFAFAANEGNTGTAKCNINFNELTQLSSVGAGAFYNAKMNLVDSTTPVAPSSRAATPVSLDLSKTKITNFEANAFAFNSDTPISILTLPTSVAIADNGIANNAFSFQSGSTIEIKGGKDVTAAQMQQLQSIIKESGATSAPISSSSVNWSQDSSGNSQFDQWQQQATSGVVISQLKFNGTSLTANNLSKYSEIANLQLKTQFTSFGDANTFANTSIGSITFGSKVEGSIAADEVTTNDDNGTKKSPTLKTIVNLFAADANSISSLINETDVLTGWADETSTNNRTGKTTPAPTTKPRKWKTINGLKWFYNPADNTISCSNLVNGYIYQKETTDQSSSRATSPAFQQFKDNQSITVTINVASDFGDSLKGNDASTPPSTGGSGNTTQGGNSRTTGSKKYN